MPRKTKAIKVTDSIKPWLRKSGDMTYSMNSKKMKKTILIVCEGQSEELYFKSFPVVTCSVSAVGVGMTKDSLVKKTIELKSQEEYDEVWCVFDMDINQGKKELSAFDNAINKAIVNNINVAYSNDSFELWYCLHFEFIDQQHRRDTYYTTLSKKLNLNYLHEGKRQEYCKAIYKHLNLIGDQKLAIKRAKKLFLSYQHLPFSKQNPVTLVYKLVELLNDNIRA
ncbi:RloB domain-containing protein [Chryseobacterium indologenes]|uniref:RloB domain-containing protein n=2 Tax=Chryseobacterium indologenes TaxID=253 RepID=A0AAD0YVI0_CHRID|nr:RloB family protein [Chryseobacterium indologenes]AYZ35066.1 RloB domain-containing protein [Chryseobacterium indologenes]AZB17721.1 RloB domain-containing protein [Chryseobacterium indologenes]MBF6643815.1 RloB domain-containing protein [Chryseobacterium indologenes]QQQ72455.1 RloB domain-containing protein [Chryseobacterium indologenes]